VEKIYGDQHLGHALRYAPEINVEGVDPKIPSNEAQLQDSHKDVSQSFLKLMTTLKLESDARRIMLPCNVE